MNRPNLHQEIIDMLRMVDDEQLLEQIHAVLLAKVGQPSEPNWWETLTDEQQQELDRAEEEIKDPKNLIGHAEAIQRARALLYKDKNNQPNWWDQLDQP